MYILYMKTESDFDPRELYSFPTEEDVRFLKELERQDEERYYKRVVTEFHEEIITDWIKIRGCTDLKWSMRRVFLIRLFLKRNYQRLVQIGVNLHQEKVESILISTLTDDIITLIHGVLFTEYENSYNELTQEVGHGTEKLTAVVLDSILLYVKDFIDGVKSRQYQ